MRFYAYLDETGSLNSKKDAYVVGMVLVSSDNREAVEARFVRLEQQLFLPHSNKAGFVPLLKWNGLSVVRKEGFLEALSTFHEDAFLCHAVWTQGVDLHTLNAEGLVRAAQHQQTEQLTVMIDGLQKAHGNKITRVLRQNRIRYDLKYGLDDEVVPLLRMADCIAGACRDRYRKSPYAEALSKHYESVLLV